MTSLQSLAEVNSSEVVLEGAIKTTAHGEAMGISLGYGCKKWNCKINRISCFNCVKFNYQEKLQEAPPPPPHSKKKKVKEKPHLSCAGGQK